MNKYILGNLKEWDKALETLAEIQKKKLLDDHQKDLIRLLRYNDNWRLREAAIEASIHVKNPDPDLIGELLRIITREDLYLDVRIIATDAIEHVLVNAFKLKKGERQGIGAITSHALECLTNLSSSPQAPIFLKALIKTQDKIKSSMESA